ncbi:PadR family transcriptional regulator [Gracilibacillus alcaliphilus]|uniref:PadR family transcriptional regulator n=1 Tax=Gracilibacillus alcaliphilus TaxID=1401441 RepID=UPI00195CA40C|nr:PadR family transcriptional regulator [Gracilibacillus alcaliphilus]MBM7679245.1 DNA-binding PadR family transcriptional regulator [Gracilibacillus alcaliphilus]
MNQSHYLLLGLLANSPKTGFDIKKVMDKNMNFYWKIGYNQIYPYLKKLEEVNYVIKSETSSSKGPTQKIYSVTEDGMEALLNWLEEDLKSIPTFRNEVLLRLNFGHQTEMKNNITLVKNYKQLVTDRQDSLKDIRREVDQNWSSHQSYIYWILTLEYGLKISQAEIEWCSFTLNKLKEHG